MVIYIFVLLQIVRLGHPARALPIVQKYSLDALLTSSDSAEIIKSVRKDIQDVQVSPTTKTQFVIS